VELIELFRNVEIFEGLTHKQLEKIAGIFDERVLEENEILFSQGDKADHLYLIKSGFVEVIIDTPISTEKRIIRNLGLCQSVGEMAWIDRGVRSATVRAITESTTVVSVSVEALDKLCEKNPKIGYRILRNIASDLSFRLRQDSEFS
jgi:CRP-like cAMP-binding protein